MRLLLLLLLTCTDVMGPPGMRQQELAGGREEEGHVTDGSVPPGHVDSTNTDGDRHKSAVSAPHQRTGLLAFRESLALSPYSLRVMPIHTARQTRQDSVVSCGVNLVSRPSGKV